MTKPIPEPTIEQIKAKLKWKLPESWQLRYGGPKSELYRRYLLIVEPHKTFTVPLGMYIGTTTDEVATKLAARVDERLKADHEDRLNRDARRQERQRADIEYKTQLWNQREKIIADLQSRHVQMLRSNTGAPDFHIGHLRVDIRGVELRLEMRGPEHNVYLAFRNDDLKFEEAAKALAQLQRPDDEVLDALQKLVRPEDVTDVEEGQEEAKAILKKYGR